MNTNPLLGRLQDNGGPTFTMLPGAGSPAIDAATGSFPGVTVDIDGQPRGEGEVKDVGADEVSEAPVLARPLTPDDVGPAYN